MLKTDETKKEKKRGKNIEMVLKKQRTKTRLDNNKKW